MSFDYLFESATAFAPAVAVTVFCIVLLTLTNWALLGKHVSIGVERRIPRQLAMLILTIGSVIAIVLMLPISEGSRNQIIALIGLLISGVFAFSSTTVFANIMAGFMLRVTKPFKPGDYIRVQDYFGRVAERGLLDSEIQTEHRELIAIPNTYLITHPISVVSSSGAVITVSVSIGYDSHHSFVQKALLDAAKNCGLDDPFVHIVDLGNFAVTYKINGVLKDAKSLLTTRSLLCAQVLDQLHDTGIEVMSANFINQRQLPPEQAIIPIRNISKASPVQSVAEEVVFDKAEKAAQRQEQEDVLKAEIHRLESVVKEAKGDEKTRIQAALDIAREQLKQLRETSKSNQGAND